MMNNSTSINSINGDIKLSLFQRLIYLFLNFIDHLFPFFNIDSDLDLKFFFLNEAAFNQFYTTLTVIESPSRKLSNLFWMNLPWAKMKKSLGNINVLDIGCGSGVYSKFLSDISNGAIDSYVGIDICENDLWKTYGKRNIRFYEYDGENVLDQIPKNTNLIVTQSAIEHFGEDISFFKQVKEFVDNCGHEVVQVHLLPSSACLYLYLFHGFRQYTPRKISNITRLFGESYKSLWSLGGMKTNIVRLKYTTIPYLFGRGDATKKKESAYNSDLIDALKSDFKLASKYPSFYALIVHSNASSPII